MPAIPRRLAAPGPRASMAVVLAALLAAAGAASPASAAAAIRAAAPAGSRPGPASAVTAAQAAALARASGRAVTVASMTTPTSLTTVSPRGRFTTTESLLPVRAWRGGRWRALDATLRRAAGGRVVPAVTAARVSLSGGGTGPVTQLVSASGRYLTLWWRGALPSPVLSGNTATYPGTPVAGASLIVTVSPQGAVSTVVQVATAVAAASPAVRSLRVTAVAPGLAASADRAGNLSFRAPAAALPAFTARAPRMWDSAPLPAGTPTVTDPASGQVLAARSGLPAVSGPGGPGAAARVTSVPVSVSGSVITLSPPASALKGPAVTYPVYIDPTYSQGATKNASAWTQIESGNTGYTGAWDETGCLNGQGGPCLQSGFCDRTGPNMSSCGGIGVERTMFRLPLPDLNTTNITVDSADVYLENVWTAACSAQKVQFWATPAINSGSDWSNDSNWGSSSSSNNLEDESFNGYGSSCGPGYSYQDVAFGTGSGNRKGVSITGGSGSAVTAVIQNDLNNGVTNQTFGLRASNESQATCNWVWTSSTTGNCTGSGSAYAEWRQWMDGTTKNSNGNPAAATELQFTWHNPPNKPSAMSSDPGGSCHSNAASEAQIGNDDMRLSATASDADGDTGLSTTFTIYSYATGLLVSTQPAAQGLHPTTALIPRATIQGWQANGSTTAYRYFYKAYTTNQDSQTSQVAGPCYFFYNPNGPSAPAVTGMPPAVTLGSSYTVTLAPGFDCSGSPAPSTCPASYTYRVGAAAPVTVSNSPAGLHGGTWTTSNDSWTGPIAVNALGPLLFDVSATDTVGNPGEDATLQLTSTAGSPLADGYFTGGAYPDLLFTAKLNAKPSLWLAPGTGNGTVGWPVDIGSLGNAVFGGNTAADGPGDWAGAQILHGDLTGNHVQDVMAYWPATTTIGTAQIPAGQAMILAGTGAAATMQPSQTFWNQAGPWPVAPVQFCDPTFDGCSGTDEPGSLTAAGNLSQNPPGSSGSVYANLVGTLCGPGGCELNLYIPTQIGGYINCDLSATSVQATNNLAPDGAADWNNFTLAAAQLPDTAHPNGDPASVMLIALNTSTGALYKSVGSGSSPSACSSTTTLAGSYGTWTQITNVPWGTSPPALLSADVNNGAGGPGSGSPEIWTASGTTATAYTIPVTGTTITTEASSLIPTPGHDWPLTDGDPGLGGTSATATDTITGAPTSTIGGTWQWAADAMFSTVLDTTATTASAYAAPPPATLPSTSATPTISLWFNTTTHDGVLASLQKQALAPNTTITSGYDPVLYIGNDGKLKAQWWTGTVQPISTSFPVDDGLWHHAVLTTTTSNGTTSQTLYLDGTTIGHITAPVTLGGIGTTTNFTFAAGYIGGGWPDENYNGQNGTPDYLNGQIADITLSQ